jgi:lipid-binding SYLF domain-containing protein
MTRILRSVRSTTLLLVGVALVIPGCMRPRGESVAEKRNYVKEMRDEALADLYKRDADLRGKVQSAAGYAVFSNIAGGILFVSTGQGYGIAHDNRSGRDTYMKMGELGAGIGLGMRHFRGIYVFNDAVNFKTFVESGWEFGGDANAAVMAGEQGVAGGAGGQAVGGGVAAGGSGSIGAGKRGAGGTGSGGTDIEVYELTESGLIARAGVAGTKYWKDSELN